MNYLIDTSFHRVNRVFVLSFLDGTGRTRNRGYIFPNVQIEDQNVMNDGQKFSQLKEILENMVKFEKFQVVKEMIAQLVIY